MHYTMENLLNGQPVGTHYRAALDHWRQCLASIDATDPKAIAEVANNEQMWFEHNCGTRWPGQEVMVWAGICQYYSAADGFGDRLQEAKAMYQGLLGSGCSVEIQGHARSVAQQYPELTDEE